MKKERAEKELQKVREQLKTLQEKEQELERIIREADKEEAAVIMDRYHISVGELLDLVKENELENKRILKNEKERMEHENNDEEKSTNVSGAVSNPI